LDVVLPQEKTHSTTSYVAHDGGEIGLPTPPGDAQDFDWPKAKFVIEGHVEDPRLDGRAGACAKVIKHGEFRTTRVEHDLRKPCFRFRNIGNSDWPGLMERGAAIAFH